jgi:hypothetical protein
MKITIELDKDDLARAIKHDLARQGLKVIDADIRLTKTGATVLVNIDIDETYVEPVNDTPVPSAPPAAHPAPTPPSFEVIDGGNAPVDMSGILNASTKLARTTEGKFPTPKHSMLDGESTEWPGPKDE